MIDGGKLVVEVATLLPGMAVDAVDTADAVPGRVAIAIRHRAPPTPRA